MGKGKETNCKHPPDSWSEEYAGVGGVFIPFVGFSPYNIIFSLLPLPIQKIKNRNNCWKYLFAFSTIHLSPFVCVIIKPFKAKGDEYLSTTFTLIPRYYNGIFYFAPIFVAKWQTILSSSKTTYLIINTCWSRRGRVLMAMVDPKKHVTSGFHNVRTLSGAWAF